jgi:hypothetical protein
MATVRNDDQAVKPSPPHPSACVQCNVLTGIHGWPVHYPGLHLIAMVRYLLTQRPSKRLSLWDPHKSHMHQYIIKLAHQGQVTWSLVDSGGATTFRAPNKKTHHSPLFPSDILHFPLVSVSCNFLFIKKETNHRTTIMRRGPIVSSSSHSTSTVSYLLSIVMLSWHCYTSEQGDLEGS